MREEIPETMKEPEGKNIISAFNYTLDSAGRRIQSKIGNRK